MKKKERQNEQIRERIEKNSLGNGKKTNSKSQNYSI